MRQYSIDRVEATWNGLDLREGIAQGSSISEGRTSPSWSAKATGYGKIVRVYNPDRSGQLTIQVDQESKLHQQLRFLAIADQQSRGIVSPFVITDTSSGEVFTYKNAFIMTEPDEVRGTDSSVFPWVFIFEDFAKTPNPTDQNIVGN
jgi:hypothetical protein